MIIYKATNKVNGKCYIGQTRHSLEERRNAHYVKARQGIKTHFYSAIRKYGEDNFEWEIICSASDKKTLNELETFYITKFDSIKNGYNMVDGGDNNIMDIESVKTKHDEKMRSAEVRAKISASMKRYRAEHPFTNEHRRKISEKALGNQHFLGHHHTEEFKKKMSAKRKHINVPKRCKRSQKVDSTSDCPRKGEIKTIKRKPNEQCSYRYKRKRITAKKVQEGRSEYDSRSVACYCIDEYGNEHHFYSYLDGGIWWFENYKPFPYSSATYQRKIKQSIKYGYATYRDLHKKTHWFYTPKWFIGGKHTFNAEIIDS